MEDIKLNLKMTSGDAASLRGKLGFAEAQCYGRIASRSMRRLGEIASGARSGTQLDRITLSALVWLMERLVNSSPRPLLADANENVVLIFTDAASEGDLHTCGGVLLDKSTNWFEYFSLVIQPELIVEWRQTGQVQIITQAEVYPVWISRSVWGHRLKCRRVVFFVDNNGAKDALVKGYMDSISGDPMLQSILVLEYEQPSYNWYARVPSPSNIADDPSRLDCKALEDDKRFARADPRQPVSFLTGVASFT
jgi:hypothetical protein